MVTMDREVCKFSLTGKTRSEAQAGLGGGGVHDGVIHVTVFFGGEGGENLYLLILFGGFTFTCIFQHRQPLNVEHKRE